MNGTNPPDIPSFPPALSSSSPAPFLKFSACSPAPRLSIREREWKGNVRVHGTHLEGGNLREVDGWVVMVVEIVVVVIFSRAGLSLFTAGAGPAGK
jgi:hypothetical protein